MQIVEFDNKYSTTRELIKYENHVVDDLPKTINKNIGKSKKVLHLPEFEAKSHQGGLRTKGYYKVGNVISETTDVIKNQDNIPKGQPYPCPLITIVTVVLNGEKFLEETIISVINQTYDAVEYIIIDGGSTDGTVGIIKKYEHLIDYWVSEKDKGIYDAMNKGIELASGKWINFMNGGDGFYSNEVLKSIFYGNDLSIYDILYGNHQVNYPSGRSRVSKAGSVKDLWKGSQFCHQASFITVQYHRSQNYNPCTKIVGDYQFFYNAWKQGAQFKYLDLTVAIFKSGGISDIYRIDTILGWWIIVDKEMKSNVYYIYMICKELLKSQLKRII